jgi:hypothetical protein
MISSGGMPPGFGKKSVEWRSSYDSNEDVAEWLAAMKDKLKNAHDALKQTRDDLETERALTIRMLSIMRKVEEEGWFLVTAKGKAASELSVFLGGLVNGTFKTAQMDGYDACTMGAFKHQKDAAAFALLFK